MTYSFEVEAAAQLLALAGNPARLHVLTLVCGQERDVGSLAGEVNLSQSALSQHLKKLRDGKLVTTRRDAQTMYYSCKSEAVAKLLYTLQELYQPAPAFAKTRRA